MSVNSEFRIFDSESIVCCLPKCDSQWPGDSSPRPNLNLGRCRAKERQRIKEGGMRRKEMRWAEMEGNEVNTNKQGGVLGGKLDVSWGFRRQSSDWWFVNPINQGETLRNGSPSWRQRRNSLKFLSNYSMPQFASSKILRCKKVWDCLGLEVS
jgi:hypothetical protein